jgi:chemotaxis protein MotB
MAGKGGGAWKVAYADFVTAMMAFFLVMWITGQSNAVKAAIAQYFKDPWKTSAKPSGDASGGSPLLPSKPGQVTGNEKSRGGVFRVGRAAVATLEKLKDAEKPKKKEKPVFVARPSLMAIHSGDQRSVGALIVFGEQAVDLDSSGIRRLKMVLPDFRGKPHKIEIRGHAVNRLNAKGEAAEDPWEQSYARCRAVMRFLVTHGIEPERIRLSQGGPFEPYSISSDAVAQARNSRVEVYMLNEFAEDLIGTPAERADRFQDAEKPPAVSANEPKGR